MSKPPMYDEIEAKYEALVRPGYVDMTPVQQLNLRDRLAQEIAEKRAQRHGPTCLCGVCVDKG